MIDGGLISILRSCIFTVSRRSVWSFSADCSVSADTHACHVHYISAISIHNSSTFVYGKLIIGHRATNNCALSLSLCFSCFYHMWLGPWRIRFIFLNAWMKKYVSGAVGGTHHVTQSRIGVFKWTWGNTTHAHNRSHFCSACINYSGCEMNKAVRDGLVEDWGCWFKFIHLGFVLVCVRFRIFGWYLDSADDQPVFVINRTEK